MENISQAIHSAVYWSEVFLKNTQPEDFRECGGVILAKPEYESIEDAGYTLTPTGYTIYQFIPIANIHDSDPIGRVLYEMNKAEYGREIIARFNKGWLSHGSFHVHPPSYDINASGVDFEHLFKNYSVNYVAGLSCPYVLRYQKLETKAEDIVWEETKLWVK